MVLSGVVGGQPPINSFIVGGKDISEWPTSRDYFYQGTTEANAYGYWVSPELIMNPVGDKFHISKFEDATGEWEAYNSVYTTSTDKASGNYAGKMILNSGSPANIHKSLRWQATSETPNDYDEIHLWIKRSAEGNFKKTRIVFGDSTFTNYFYADLTLTTSWQDIMLVKADFTQIGTISWETITDVKFEVLE